MKFKSWLESSGIITTDIENLLPSKSDMEVAVHSLQNGRPSTDKGPIEVYQAGDKYVVANGHHRLLQAILRGDASVKIKVLPSTTPISANGTVVLDFYDGDFYGLDSSLENGWLLKRLKSY
jgi:hypothetical protein